MPFEIHWENRCVFVRYHGAGDESTVLDAVITLQSDHRFDTTPGAVHDFGDCASIAYSLEHLEEVAARNVAAANYQRKLRIAVIPDRSDLTAMIDAFEQLGLNPYPIRQFGTLADAQAWIKG